VGGLGNHSAQPPVTPACMPEGSAQLAGVVQVNVSSAPPSSTAEVDGVSESERSSLHLPQLGMRTMV